MKKIVLGLTACALGVALLGCSASQSALGQSLDSKMTDLQNTINSISAITVQDISLSPMQDENIEPSATTSTGYANWGPYGMFGNVNTFGMPGFGMYPYQGFYGMGNFGYANGFANAYNPYMPNRWVSNIDTYRINQVEENGTSKTTVDTYHNGKHTGQTVFTDDADQNQTQNLRAVCENCFVSNFYGDELKNQILNNIAYVKQLSSKIRNADIPLSNHQVKSVNSLLDNIAKQQNKINMTKSELFDDVENVRENKTIHPQELSGKYVRLLGTMDARNAYLKSILSSLLQVEDTIDGTCQNGYCWNGDVSNPNWLANCPNGECNNCQDCQTCTTCNNCTSCQSLNTCTDCSNCQTSSGCNDCTNCTNCLLCTNCQDCDNCFNCSNCTNCTNLANVSGWVNNKPCEDCQNNDLATLEETQNNQVATDLPQRPSTGSIEVEETNQRDEIEFTTSSDEVIEDNLLENQEYQSDTFDQKRPSLIQPRTQEESILNENPHENNKALTA